MIVPLEPRRYYELGRIAEAHFAGRCLDVSSPKVLPAREGVAHLRLLKPTSPAA